ncbi:hypothetical protein DY218_27225 [Streptomyces triticagri]|uniref:PKD domain-containing protein n=1 Tax=Streptomyces triticagri TaxID=2293568 RepID=A0A372LY67_9ACTN|nr:hypothetical protein [Streptomyces triticagri]RFU83602.1 hypothetical protein DY218_27225 [Streptomyces triticagri]
MPSKCATFAGAAMLRFTRLDNCCRPSYGECGSVVTDGVISMTISSEVEDGDTNTVTKINGKACATSKTDDVFQYATVEIEFCVLDPDVVTMMNANWPKVYDAFGNVVGFDVTSELGGANFALEVWPQYAQSDDTDACSGEEAGEGGQGYLLFPCLSGGAPDDIEINGEDNTSFTFSGNTKASTGGWASGPYQVQLDENGVPGGLVTPVPAGAHYRVMTAIDVAPPEPPEECGCEELIRPTPPPAELQVTGVAGENPRQSVRIRPNNHGFGAVIINWGDNTPETNANDGIWTTHKYAADGDYTITVRDAQTPGVVTSLQVTVPLGPDEPQLTLTADDPDDRMAVTAQIVMPAHAPKKGTIAWGDGTPQEEFEAAEDGTINLVHTYARPNIYTVTVQRTDVTTFRARAAVTVPVAEPPTATVATAALVATMTIDNHGNGPTTIAWGDGKTSDGPDQGTAEHTYTEAGTYQARVTSKVNPASGVNVEVTVTA